MTACGGADPRSRASQRAPSMKRWRNMATILVVDDDFAFTRVLSDVLSDAGYRTLVAEDGPRALQLVRAQRPTLALIDLILPGMSGAALLAQICSDADPALPVIILSANPAAR